MKTPVLLLCLALSVVCAAPKRSKRAAYELPDGADLLIGPIRTSFNCLGDGYYADVENNCQIFHVCHTTEDIGGNVAQQQWSFLCGNQTMFNQFSLTCANPEESIPCSESSNFFYLNERLRSNDPKMYFHNDEDLQRAAPYLYRNTIGAGAAAAPGGAGRVRGG